MNMRGRFSISKALANCSHIPELGEVFLYQYDPIQDLWHTRIGDGKTQAKDLPPLANYDIYERVRILEEEVEKLKNDRRI